MNKLNNSITFSCGVKMKNRFMLAPLTNTQSYEDGTLSDEELHWLTMRAKGQFGIVMTCASHVQAIGKGFPGQLGIFNENQMEGHQRLAKSIQDYGCLSVVQLYHGGMRADQKYIEDAPVSASAVERKGTRALTLIEVRKLRDDFVEAAIRAKKCGHDGIEIHGGHGYIIAQFLSQKINQREDEYGGSLKNRARLLFEIVDRIRESCGTDFLLGVRLSPERFGMQLSEIKTICLQLIDGGKVDFLDLSLWDCFKFPEEEEHRGKTLLQHFTDLDFKNVKLTVAGKIHSAKNVSDILNSKVDFVTIGRSGILHHDFPLKVMSDSDFKTVALPVSKEHLQKEGLSEKFIEYMRNWKGFVAE